MTEWKKGMRARWESLCGRYAVEGEVEHIGGKHLTICYGYETNQRGMRLIEQCTPLPSIIGEGDLVKWTDPNDSDVYSTGYVFSNNKVRWYLVDSRGVMTGTEDWASLCELAQEVEFVEKAKKGD